MRCSDVRVLTSDWLDGLLSESQMNTFQKHLASCQSCSRYTTEMQQILAALCSTNKTQAAPPDFTNRVMSRLREEEAATVVERRFMRFPLKSLAMAASILLLLGINNFVVSDYVAGKFIKPAPAGEAPVAEKPAPVKIVAQAPAPELVDAPEEALTNPEDILAAAVSEEPVQEFVEEIRPVEIEVMELEKPSKPEPIVVAEAPKSSVARNISLDDLVLPAPGVFVNGKRVTESTVVKLYVPQIDEAVRVLAANANMQGLAPAQEYTASSADGRVIKVYRYDVPYAQANQFANAAYGLGRVIGEEWTNDDITGEYEQKLAEYRQLVERSLAATGEEAEQLNESINSLVGELAIMDKKSKEMKSVIVWLES